MSEDGNHSPDTGFTAMPSPSPDPAPADEPRPDPGPPAEVLPPTPVVLSIEGGFGSGGARPVLAALTADALWLQDTWRLRHVPLSALAGIEMLPNGKELALTVPPGPSAERFRLTFAGVARARLWHGELLARREQLPAEAPPATRRVPEGVALVKGGPGPSHVVVGQVEFSARTPRTADRGLQLRAALLGADAVVWLWRQKGFDSGQGNRHVSGTAIRVEDAAERQQLRKRWFGDEVRSLANRMLLLLVIRVALLLLVGAFCAGASRLHEATGEEPGEALKKSGLAFGLFFAWPLVLVVLLRLLRRPELLPAAGLALLAATTGRGLTVMAAHVLAVRGAELTGPVWCLLLDPVDWAFILLGLALFARARRLASDAPDILPPGGTAVAPTRGAWSRALLGLSGVFALVLLGFAGTFRYRASTYLAQPGIEPRREQEALLAFSRGGDLMDRDENAAAERSFRDSLRVWEELTRGPAVPPAYRANLGRTLYDLALACHRQGRLDEAESYYARVVAVGDQLGDDPAADADFRRCLAESRRVVAELREDRVARLLDEKDKLGIRKYEEAVVKGQQGGAEAAGLYGEAIALWEEILPQAPSRDIRRYVASRLAAAYLQVGDLRQRQGQRREAEAALLKAIEYGEEAVKLAPDRPLARRNLDLARQMLEDQREEDLQKEVVRLCAARRFADAAATWARCIEEQEELLRAGKDSDAVSRRLAVRLARSAWFLAHCPDGRVRDTKAAVNRARRATELQRDVGEHWYTLAMVQYRNRDWGGSLKSLEQLKAREGEHDGSDWLLIAMNRYQLKQRKEAREAFQKAVEWIEERQRQGEDNAALRLQYEMMRPGLESLRREAEDLLQGKDPGGRGIG
jgi:tetratricopeptide (TPR) repeat protein